MSLRADKSTIRRCYISFTQMRVSMTLLCSCIGRWCIYKKNRGEALGRPPKPESVKA